MVFLRISKFTIEAGGTIKIENGARLILTNNGSSAYVCNGSFIVDGLNADGENCYIQAGQSCDYPVGDNITSHALITIQATMPGGTFTPAIYKSNYAHLYECTSSGN